ncbi:MAG: 4'-phosphopantetheinyl transferase superfamily protein [Gammaproteobacteria bacterium]|nr:4'-phosphopantetheinyl transferase superfamily protein [Gammaproteobacteria bacterium]
MKNHDETTEISQALMLLFPIYSIVRVARISSIIQSDFPEEKNAITGATAKRRDEYYSVRACARSALGQLGVEPKAIPNAADRSPIWPEDIVGSLTHAGKYCAAVVARDTDLISVGIDIEVNVDLDEEFWGTVLTSSEHSWLLQFVTEERGKLAMLIFSAKECFFKCWYPMQRSFLEFHDVELAIDLQAHTFSPSLRMPHKHVKSVDCWQGRFSFTSGYLLTAMVWERRT